MSEITTDGLITSNSGYVGLRDIRATINMIKDANRPIQQTKSQRLALIKRIAAKMRDDGRLPVDTFEEMRR
jgi:flagellar motor component MotA